jgi:hypothetical protein
VLELDFRAVKFLFFPRRDLNIKKSNEIRMLVHVKEISKKKNKTDFSQHSCTNIFTAVADLQVQCLYIYIYIDIFFFHTSITPAFVSMQTDRFLPSLTFSKITLIEKCQKVLTFIVFLFRKL